MARSLQGHSRLAYKAPRDPAESLMIHPFVLHYSVSTRRAMRNPNNWKDAVLLLSSSFKRHSLRVSHEACAMPPFPCAVCKHIGCS